MANGWSFKVGCTVQDMQATKGDMQYMTIYNTEKKKELHKFFSLIDWIFEKLVNLQNNE